MRARELVELQQSIDDGARVITDPDLLVVFQHDQATLASSELPLAAIQVTTTAQVQQVMRWASAHQIPVVPRGAGSGLAGGATSSAGCVVLDLSRMTTIRELSPQTRVAVVEAGVINADLNRELVGHGLMFAPDPSSHEMCSVGGNAATNAGGLRCVKYGVTRDSVLGLEVVLPDGRLLRTGGQTVKNVAGLDLTSLFVGSEGTLGVITAVTVKLLPIPQGVTTVTATFADLSEAGRAVSAVVASGLRPSLLELIDEATLAAIESWRSMGLAGTSAMLIGQCDGPGAQQDAERLAEVFTDSGAVDVLATDDPDEADMLLQVRRLAYPAAEQLGQAMAEDVGVPVDRLAEMIGRIERVAAKHGVLILTVAHAGDGNLHPTLVFRPDDPGPRSDGQIPDRVWAAADEIFSAAIELGGTITGEHGVGMLKTRWLAGQLGDTGVEVTEAIRAAVDPRGIMNPGKGLVPAIR